MCELLDVTTFVVFGLLTMAFGAVVGVSLFGRTAGVSETKREEIKYTPQEEWVDRLLEQQRAHIRFLQTHIAVLVEQRTSGKN